MVKVKGKKAVIWSGAPSTAVVVKFDFMRCSVDNKGSGATLFGLCVCMCM